MPKRNSDWDDDEDDRPRRRSRRRDDDEDDDEEEERPRKRRRRRKPSPAKSSLPLVLGLVGGGVLLLVAVGAVVALSFIAKGGGPGGTAKANNPLGGVPGLPPGPPPVVRPPLPPGWVDFKHPDCNLSIYCPQRPFAHEYTSTQPLGTPVADGKRNSKGYNSPSLGQKLWCYVGASDHAPSFSQSARDFDLGESFFFQNATTRDVMWGGRMAKEVSGELKVEWLPRRKGLGRCLGGSGWGTASTSAT